MSDTLPGTTLPDDNHDRPWWGLPCTVTPCFGARLVQEGNRLHYLPTAPVLEACSAMQMRTTWTRPFRC
ncbi:antitoxin of the YeeV-YeeU toxin-antitoxin system; CP4-44 prophage [Escherichia coli]|uniref:Antitoxin of the YeeV-YeeU toxin-antitoxin system CP4-44 prophage n=1 Tax=Escherichia coli TaxID=562 RepID=A0A376UFU2_ECOLX|nr:antitoxin of the YeeV-YeeU toxin-antitoxin system; CP4-44 prophage [Escherichia coli]